MAITKSALAVLGGALLLGGCATGPYYDNYGYDYGYNEPGPAYYGPGYVGPSVGFGVGFADFGGDRYRHHDRDGDRHDWHGDRGDRGDHDWHGDRGDHDSHRDRGQGGSGG